MKTKQEILEIAKKHLDESELNQIEGFYPDYSWVIPEPIEFSEFYYFDYKFKCKKNIPEDEWISLCGAPGYSINKKTGQIEIIGWTEYLELSKKRISITDKIKSSINKMKRAKSIIAFILGTILLYVVCSFIITLVLIVTFEKYGVRYEQSNLWGAELIFYVTLLFYPISFLVQKYLKLQRQLPRYLIWLIFPLIYVLLYSLGIYFGLNYQLKLLATSKFPSLLEFPVAINLNFILLNYFLVASIFIAIVIEALWIKRIISR